MNNPKNPKLFRCGACKKDIRGLWWVQISHNVFCKKHYKRAFNKLNKYERNKI